MLTRTGVALAVLGGVLGGAVATIVHFVTTVQPTLPHGLYDGHYVPLQGITMSRAYESTLNVTFDRVHPAWWPMLPLYVAVGLVVGVAAAALLARRRPLSGSSPT